MSRRSKPEPKPSKADAKLNAEALRASAEAFRKRRNRRYLVLGGLALTFPILEIVAYQYRAIEVVVTNDYPTEITGIQIKYPGGEWSEARIGPGDTSRRRIRPDFRFSRSQFSTYDLDMRFSTPTGRFHQYSRAGTIDYSASEVFTIVAGPPDGRAEIRHATRPGFPLGLIRDGLKRIGIN